MKCIFCKTGEKEVRYMLTKDKVCICDRCVLLLSKELSNQLEKDSIDIISKIKRGSNKNGK